LGAKALVRKETAVPIVLISTLDAENETLAALGAYDYLTKPFGRGRRFEESPVRPRYLITESGIGYRLIVT
jgi:hypothetical protein